MLAFAVSSIRLSEQSINVFTISLMSPTSLIMVMDTVPEEGNCASRRSIVWSPSRVMNLFRLLILLDRSLQSPRSVMCVELSLIFGGYSCDSLMGYAFTDISGSSCSLSGYTALEQFVMGTVREEALTPLLIVAFGA